MVEEVLVAARHGPEDETVSHNLSDLVQIL